VIRGFEALKQSGFSDSIESKLQSKNGDIIDVEIRSFSLYDSDNKFDRSFSIIRDIREKKRLQAQLFQQSKLAGIGELAAGIVHDIRNPLSIIMGLSRTVLQKAIASQDLIRVEEVRTKIDKASERINRLCSHLRDYVRQDQEQASPTPVRSLIEDCFMICENRIRSAHATVVNEVVDPELVLPLPANSLEQVLINIVSNACDAVAGSPVRTVRVRVELAESQISFVVEDTGPGVPQAFRVSIFDSFFTTKPKGEGTGLGLSICKGIIEEHGGSLSLDESYTEGARFVISLPRPGAE
jgi:C4-dicarboxylate-specific signal transduction histidine kinase